MTVQEVTYQPALNVLLVKGEEQGFLTFDDVSHALPASERDDVAQLDDLLERLSDAGISIVAEAPDMENLEASDEVAADEDFITIEDIDLR